MNDVKYAIRQLFKNPGFTIVIVLTLGLAIGANSAIFSMINSVLIKPLPYPDADRIVQVFETTNSGHNSVSGGVFKDWKEHSQQFSNIAMFKSVRRNMTGGGAPENLSGLVVTTEYLSVFGISPMLGRDFAAGEDAIGGNNNVLILSHSFWNSRFNSDRNVIGKVISLNQVPHTIIGVLPQDATMRDDLQFLTPVVIDVEFDTIQWSRGFHWGEVIGRLKPEASPEAALAELRTIRQRLNAEYPVWKAEWGIDVLPLQETFAEDARPTLAILFGTVALVLLIACANVSNLLLARGTMRAREMAIRTALGAQPWQIVRQQLIESVMLALVGCALGVLLATLGIRILSGMVAEMLPSALRPALDANVLIFSIVIASACGLLFGILPAIRATRANSNSVLKETERGSTSVSKRRAQSLLVVSEFAFTILLLIGAGLFLRSFAALLKTDPGFKAENTLAFDVALPAAKYSNAEEQQRFIQDLNDRIASLPGVQAVGAVTTLPLSQRGRGSYVARPDKPDQGYVVGDDFVSGDYFSAMGIELLRGRAITRADNEPGAPRVLVIDAGIARDLFPNEDPVGQHLSLLEQSWEVVGVVAAVRHGYLDKDPRPRFYGARVYQPYPDAAMVVRSTLPASTLVESVRKSILQADPDQPIANIRTLEEAVDKSLKTRRSTLILLGAFASAAIALACIGIYGVMAHAVAQRARELSIRSALGAQRRQIVRMMLLGGMKPSVVGILLGLVGAVALSRVVESQLFEVKARDPIVFAASVCLLSIVAAVSVLLPARRAANANPMEALRHE